jgi:hypothetical protein
MSGAWRLFLRLRKSPRARGSAASCRFADAARVERRAGVLVAPALSGRVSGRMVAPGAHAPRSSIGGCARPRSNRHSVDRRPSRGMLARSAACRAEALPRRRSAPKRAAEAGFDEPLLGGQAVDWNDFRIFQAGGEKPALEKTGGPVPADQSSRARSAAGSSLRRQMRGKLEECDVRSSEAGSLASRPRPAMSRQGR